MGTWLSHRHALAVIDDELGKLSGVKLDTSPADPGRPGLLRAIDALLDQRLEESRALAACGRQ